MPGFSPETHESGDYLNVHEVCERFFRQAYNHQLMERGQFINIVGDAELLRLHGRDENHDAILGRPIGLTATPEGVMFWLHIISLSLSHYRRIPYLAAVEHDPSRWYIKEREDQPVRPYALGKSREITKFLDSCYMMPVQSEDI